MEREWYKTGRPIKGQEYVTDIRLYGTWTIARMEQKWNRRNGHKTGAIRKNQASIDNNTT